MPHPFMLVGLQLHARRPSEAQGLVKSKRAREIVGSAMLQAARQDSRVLHRHRRALAHVWLHRMTGVAEQYDSSAAPDLARIAIQHRPRRRLRASGDLPLHLRMETFEGGGQRPHVGRPRREVLIGPFFGDAGDEVDLVAPGGQEVRHEVAVFGPPLGRIGDLEVAQQRDGVDRPVRHVAGIDRALGTQQDFADPGIDAVRADHDAGIGAGAVGERQPQRRVPVLKGHQTLAEL